MLHSIPGSRGEGSDLPGHHQINEVTITQSPPNRSGHMLMEKQTTLSCRSLIFSGTVHWFEGRQAFIHYCGLHQV